MGGGAFSNANHFQALREKRRDIEEKRDDANESKIKGVLRDLNNTKRCLIVRVKSTGF